MKRRRKVNAGMLSMALVFGLLSRTELRYDTVQQSQQLDSDILLAGDSGAESDGGDSIWASVASDLPLAALDTSTKMASQMNWSELDATVFPLTEMELTAPLEDLPPLFSDDAGLESLLSCDPPSRCAPFGNLNDAQLAEFLGVMNDQAAFNMSAQDNDQHRWDGLNGASTVPRHKDISFFEEKSETFSRFDSDASSSKLFFGSTPSEDPSPGEPYGGDPFELFPDIADKVLAANLSDTTAMTLEDDELLNLVFTEKDEQVVTLGSEVGDDEDSRGSGATDDCKTEGISSSESDSGMSSGYDVSPCHGLEHNHTYSSQCADNVYSVSPADAKVLAQIGFTPEEVIGTTQPEFTRLLSDAPASHHTQLRCIRRRGRNKLAATRSRARKQDNGRELSQEVSELEERRQSAFLQLEEAQEQASSLEKQFRGVQEAVMEAIRQRNNSAPASKIHLAESAAGAFSIVRLQPMNL